MDNSTSITIIIPVHNEEENISLLVKRLSTVAASLPEYCFEILFINDGSTDHTLEAIRKQSADSLAIGYLQLSRNFGHQAALEAGLRYAKGDVVISMDGDLQHPPEMIPAMLEQFANGADVVQMQRANTGSDYKGILSVSFYAFFRCISKVPLVPNAADFRLISRRVVSEINNHPGKGKLLRVLIPSLGFKCVHLPYRQDDRKHGKPKYTLAASYELALHTIFKFSGFPANVMLFSGMIFTVAGIALFVLIVLGIFHEENLRIALAAMLSLSGMMLFCCGILSHYLRFILEQVRGEPSFIVSKVVYPRHAQVADKC